jgi:hypothetical protein
MSESNDKPIIKNKHIDSGIVCAMYHGVEAQCCKCKLCGEFLRPKEFYGTECNGFKREN